MAARCKGVQPSAVAACRSEGGAGAGGFSRSLSSVSAPLCAALCTGCHPSLSCAKATEPSLTRSSHCTKSTARVSLAAASVARCTASCPESVFVRRSAPCDDR